MSLSIKFGTVILAIGLAGATAWNGFHRSTSFAGKVPVKSLVISPSVAKPNPPETAVADGWTFPNPSVSATDDELLALARKAVDVFPLRAIDWARSQTDATLRRRLLSAVIRAWGEKDPATAVDWVLRQNDDERRTDMEAALAGAARQPELALAIVRQLLLNDPDDPDACGPALVAALSNAGQFQTLLEFLYNGAPADSRADWANAAFRRWGQSSPQDALAALASITDENLRETAFHSLVDGWSQDDPSTLAGYAVSLPVGADRDYASQQAFDNWSLQDPAAMASWLSRQPAGAEFDEAAAQMISKTDSANCPPATALNWVENINDAKLKLETFTHVISEWNQTDPAAAQQYAANTTWLDAQSRQKILQSLQSPPPGMVASGD